MTIQSLVGLKNLIEKKDKGTFQLEDYAEICLGFLNFVLLREIATISFMRLKAVPYLHVP